MLAALALALIVFGALASIKDQEKASAWVAHTLEVLLLASDLQLQMQTAVSEGRGFHLNHTQDFVARFGEALRQVHTDQRLLAGLTADDARQQDTLHRLAPLITQRLGILQSRVGIVVDGTARQYAGATAAQATAAMTQVVAGIADMEAEETRLLTLRRQGVANARTRATLSLTAGGALLTGSLGLAVFAVNRRRREAQNGAALAAVNATLNQRVKERTLELAMVADALRDREAQQQRILDHAPFAMAILTRRQDREYAYEYVNLAFLEIYGGSQAAYLGRTVAETWPAGTDRLMEGRLAACEAGTVQPFQSLIQHGQDGYRHLDGVLAPLPGSKHGPRQILSCTRDITAKVQLERLVATQVTALRAAEERQRRLFEATPAMAVSIDRRGRLLAVSDAWLTAMGLARDAAVGRSVSDFLAPGAREQGLTAIALQLAELGRVGGMACQAVRQDGTVIDVLASAVMERDARGRWCVHAVMEDVTIRRVAERALSHERERLANLIAATGVGTWEWNPRTDAFLVNARFCEMFGWSPEAPPSFQEAGARLHPDEVESSTEMFRQLVEGERFHSEQERRLQHLDGHYVWLVSRVSVITRPGDARPEWLIGAFTDITARKRQEVALRKSEDFLERTGRCAGIGGWELDIASGVLTWSAETARIHGLPVAHAPSVEAAINFYAPQARPVIEAALNRCLADGTGWDLELPFHQADGTPIWVRAVGAAVVEDGRTVRLTGAFQDVSQTVRQRLALQEAQARVALATEGANIGIWGWDVPTGSMQWDACTRRLFGGAGLANHPTYKDWLALLHPDDRDRTDATLRQHAALLLSCTIEYRVVRADSTQRHIRAVAQVTQDGADAGTRIIGVNWDVTEAYRLTQERDQQIALLAESEANFRLIAENSKDMITRVGADGRRIYASSATQTLLGISVDALMAQGLEPLVHPQDLTLLAARQSDLLRGQRQDASITFRVLNPVRGEVWVETAAKAVAASDGPAGYIAISRDVTERVRHEAELTVRARELQDANDELDRLARHMAEARNAAERANRAKTRFLAGMSHELRTPLNGILGYAQLLRMDGGLSPTQSARVHAMLRAGRHLLDMISAVLDLREFETGTIEIHRGGLDIVDLAESCLAMIRPAAEEKNLAVSLNIEPGLPRRLISDAPRLRQILINLLGNAVKYTQAGSVSLGLHTAAPGGERRLLVDVADTGPGIPAAKRHLLFEEFERLGLDGSDASEGAGLGLYLSRRLAGALGGELIYDDHPAGGSIFRLELPLITNHAAASALPDTSGGLTEPGPAGGAPDRDATGAGEEPGASAAAPQQGASGAKPDPGAQNAALPPILVVDDVPMNRDIAASFLRSAGYRVLCAEDGAKGVAMATTQELHVILMDVRMPGMDGLEATRRIRALAGPCGQIPIIAVTAQAFTEQIEACRRAGMDTHLAKPFTVDTLLDTVSRAAAAGRPNGEDTTLAPHTEYALLNTQTFTQTAGFLSSEAMTRYLQSVVEQIESLRHSLSGPMLAGEDADATAASAHTLAGSAGLFGCDRLVFVARQFDAAVGADPDQLNVLAGGMLAVMRDTLTAIRARQ